MPYLQCARCRRSAWVRSPAADAADCRHCGTPLAAVPGGEARHLAAAVRDRLARDARRHPAPPRFVRDSGPQRPAA